MIEAEPKIFREEEEANKKLKAISEQKERERALEFIAKQIVESVSEGEMDELMRKVKEQRDLRPAS